MVRGTIVEVVYNMTFEFLIVCNADSQQEIRDELADILLQVLDESDIEYDSDETPLDEILRFLYDKTGVPDTVITSRIVIGISLEPPSEIVFDTTMIENFIDNLSNSDLVSHIVKFEDPLLQGELSERAKEIFAIEMKLRRILSLMYLSAYQDRDPYDLFIDGRFKPRPSQKLEMTSLVENQFFHLDFRNYININIPGNPQISDIMEFIRSSVEYEEFRSNILNALILTDDKDVSFLENLKRIMNPIEEMRNCVAHNRRPPDNVSQNYPQAREDLENLMNEYLEQWEIQGST